MDLSKPYTFIFYKRRKVIISMLMIFGLSICSFAQVDSVDYSLNKEIPEDIRDIALDALSHYPELQDVNIIFRYKDDIRSSFMQAQPDPTTLFGRKKDRIYIVTMTPFLLVDEEKIPLEQLPKSVLVGWLGHELGHVLDYHKRRWYNIALFGVAYVLFDQFKIAAERTADLYAIDHGLGNQIIATKNFILQQSAFPKFYKDKIRGIYMSPEEVFELVQKDKEEATEEVRERQEDLRK